MTTFRLRIVYRESPWWGFGRITRKRVRSMTSHPDETRERAEAWRQLILEYDWSEAVSLEVVDP